MKFQDLKVLIDAQLDALPEGIVEMHVAEKLAPNFLKLNAKIAEMRMLLAVQRTKFYSLQKTSLKAATLSAISEKSEKRGTGPTAEDRKKLVEADPEYLSATEGYETISARIGYLSVMLDTFSNLHVFYRQVSKGGDL